jgi:hypothetical protein
MGDGMTHSLRFQGCAEYIDAATRAKRTLEAISDALRSAPFAPVPRHLLQKPQKPPKEPGKRPEQSREYEDYVARRMARGIYRLPVATEREALPDTQPKPPLDAVNTGISEVRERAANGIVHGKIPIRFCRASELPAELKTRGLEMVNRKGELTAGSDGSSPFRQPSLRKKHPKAKRSRWLDEQLNGKSDVDLHHESGLAYNTIRRYRSGQVSTRDAYVRKKLADWAKCSLEEVPL